MNQCAGKALPQPPLVSLSYTTPLLPSLSSPPTSPFSPSPAALHYNIPLWYSSPHGAFEVIGPNHPHLIAFRRICNGIAVRCKDWDYSHHPTQECLRLNLGVTLPLEPQDLSPSTPSLHPRPGPLSPTSEIDIFKMFSKDFFSPKKVMVSYSAVVPAGQVPSLVFIGWTTSGFRYIESQFHSGAHLGSEGSPSLLRYGQQVDVVTERRHSSTSSFSTAFLVCLSELLTDAQDHIPSAITYVTVTVLKTANIVN